MVDFLYSDGSQEIANAARLDGTPHTACEPGDKQANGIAERQVQEIKLCTASNLAQAGLPHPYWVYAMNHAMMGLNVVRGEGGEPTPWENRFGEAFPGRLVPFGAAVTFHPNRENKGRTSLPFADKAVEGIFLGYHRTAGEQWKGEYEVAFFSDFAKVPLIHGYKPARVEVLPVRTSRLYVPDGPWVFPLRERYVRENGTLGGAEVAQEMLRNADLLWGQLGDVERPALKDVLELAPEHWPTRPVEAKPAQASAPPPAIADAPRVAPAAGSPEPDGKPAILGSIPIHKFPHKVNWNRLSADGLPHVIARPDDTASSTWEGWKGDIGCGRWQNWIYHRTDKSLRLPKTWAEARNMISEEALE